MHDRFANAQRIFTLDAQISHCAIGPRIDKQKLILGVAPREWLVFPLHGSTAFCDLELFLRCERAQRKNRTHKMGSLPPFAAQSTKVRCGPLVTLKHSAHTLTNASRITSIA